MFITICDYVKKVEDKLLQSSNCFAMIKFSKRNYMHKERFYVRTLVTSLIT